MNASYVEFAIAYVAVLRAGAVAVPVPRALPADELSSMARQVGASLTLRDLNDLESLGDSERPFPDPRPDDLAEILFTSGSTGVPKAVAVPHANLAGSIALDELTHRPDGTQLHAIPLGTNWAQFALRATLSTGTQSIVMPRFEARHALDLIELHRPTELLLVPPMALMLLAAAAGSDRDLGSVRTVRLSAAPIAPAKLEELRRIFPAATIQVGYSSTEASPACTIMELPGDPRDTVGRPAAGHDVQIVGPEGHPVAAGRLGAIRLRARTTPSRSYLHTRPEDRRVFEAGGWVRTGDLGVLDADGYLRLRGREAEVINVGGLKVYGPEVEAALLEHPRVIDAAVFGAPSELLGEQPVAAVVVTSPIDGRELGRFARERLASHKVPAVIRIVETLPTNRAGKVSKLEQRRRFASGVGRCAENVHTDDLERQLLELWRETLALDDLRAEDDLAEQGADSLTVFAVAAQLKERSGIAVPPSRLLLLSTVRAQARAVAELAAR